MEEHKRLIDEYEETKKLRNKCTKKTLIFEAFIVVVVCAMKFLQKSASLNLNLIATGCVSILVVWHFWGFKYRRAIDSKESVIILEGYKTEKNNPFLGMSFFQAYMEKFNVIGRLCRLAIFDFFFLYFFSVSATQLLNSIDPVIVVKLGPSSIRTLIISAFLGIAYYQPIKPLAHLKRKLESF